LALVVRRCHRAKPIIAAALNAMIGDHSKVFEAAYAQIHETI
jgi:hypothetical protein